MIGITYESRLKTLQDKIESLTAALIEATEWNWVEDVQDIPEEVVDQINEHLPIGDKIEPEDY